MSRQYAVLPHDYLEEMSCLSDEEFGKLCRYLLLYTRDGEIIPEEGNLKFVARSVMNKADRYAETFEKIESRNRANGQKGGRPKNPTKPKETQENPTKPNKTQKTQTDTETDTDTDINNISSNEDMSLRRDVSKQIIEFWNTKIDRSKVKILTDRRISAINARVKASDVETVKDVISKVAESPFLNGDNDRGWTADFDWCMNPSNFTKILEGNYTRRTGKAKTDFNKIETESRDFAEDESLFFANHRRR